METMDTFEHRLTQYRTLEIKIKEKADLFKQSMEPYVAAREKLRAYLLDMLNTSGQESAKTKAGTVYKTIKRSASLDDPDAFKRHVIGSENWDLLDWKANLTATLDYAEANEGVLPPGVKIRSTRDIGVRAPAAPRKTKATTSESNDASEGEQSDEQVEREVEPA